MYVALLLLQPFNASFPGLPGWAGTRKVKAIWILLVLETKSGSGISWAICKSAPRCQYPTTLFFTGQMPFLPPNQQCQSIEGTGTFIALMKCYCRLDSQSQGCQCDKAVFCYKVTRLLTTTSKSINLMYVD